jgi:hypothetical protein
MVEGEDGGAGFSTRRDKRSSCPSLVTIDKLTA